MTPVLTPGGSARLEAHGLRVDLPRRWEGRIYLRDTPTADAESPAGGKSSAGGDGQHPAARGWKGEVPNPVLHVANFALPPGRGDFGTGAVERLRPGHVFMSLFEYDRAEAGQPLFAAVGVPRPAAHEFSPNALQRRLRGHGGWQRFFTEHGRAFSLYVVLGDLRDARHRVGEIAVVLNGLRIGAR